MTKILMVCRANICRSPMARAVAQQIAREMGLSAVLEFDSAGTHAVQGGERIDPRARAVLTERQCDPGKARSRAVKAQDFQDFDLIVAMDESNLASLRAQCPTEHHDKLHLLLGFAPALDLKEVPDPYYGNLAGFERVLELCQAGVRGLIEAQT